MMGRRHGHRRSVARRTLVALVSSAPAHAQTGPRPDPHSEQHPGRHDEDSAARGDSAPDTAAKPRFGQSTHWRSACGRAAVRSADRIPPAGSPPSGSMPPPPGPPRGPRKAPPGLRARFARLARRPSSCSRLTSSSPRPNRRHRRRNRTRARPRDSGLRRRPPGRRAARGSVGPCSSASGCSGRWAGGVVHGLLLVRVDRPRCRPADPPRAEQSLHPGGAVRHHRRGRHQRHPRIRGFLNRLYTAIGDASALPVNVGVRPLVVGLIVGGLVGLLGRNLPSRQR